MSSSKLNKDILLEINSILNNNALEDLNSNLKKRSYLNRLNICLDYFFYLSQASAILITAIAVSNNNTTLAWVGVGLNSISSIINIYEKINSNIMKKMLIDIKEIKKGIYLDEGEIIDPDKKVDH